ncbi:MAG: transcription antitermination factor NusB [Planctomycetota bacterium]
MSKYTPRKHRPFDVRREAQRILQQLEDPEVLVFAAELIDDADQRHHLSTRDRRFLTEVTYGVLRQRGTLDAVLAKYAETRLDQLERPVLAALRIGLYQLLFLDGIPPFAAVSTAVGLMRREIHLRRFVNGVLRTIAREMHKVDAALDRGGANPTKRLQLTGKVVFFSRAVFTDPGENEIAYLAEVHSYPQDLVRRWVAQHGRDRAEQLMRHGNERPVLCVRVNRQRLSLDAVQNELATDGIPSDVIGPVALQVKGSASDLLASRAFRSGHLTVQGAFAQQAIPLLDPKPGTLCVDLCAAPGGKTTHMAEFTGDRARILACDVDARRLRRVITNVRRLRLSGIHPLVVDATRPIALRQPAASVLVDVPCSNTGVLKRRPEARWRFSPARLASLVELQRKLLDAAAPLVAPGGHMLYSTCSIEPEENELRASSFVTQHAAFRVVTQRSAIPGETTDDGGYLALFEREA